MVLSILSALGGIGLFLVGMMMLTDGLKALAGHRLRNVLAGFTSTPFSGAVTGALTTAAIQSSSATTVAAVGFVASGLLTFPQALGVIFGANIGTTLTGWLVALLGFKLDLGQVVMPLVFIGALMKLSGRRRLSVIGQALAGFSLIFVGIEQLKLGLDAFGGVITPEDFPPDTLFGRFKLVLLGIVITLITQSSSAGVATALAALSAGALNFQQAAALVIGMDVGTTFTAALATLGGGTMAKRTGYAHVIYNVLTGMMAFFLLGPFSVAVSGWVENGDPLTALVAFHSSFNFLGVILILPFARQFARLVEALVPERGDILTRSLDEMMLRDPEAATAAARTAVERLAKAVVTHLRGVIGASGVDQETLRAESLERALADTRDYLGRIVVPEGDSASMRQITGMFHILDHLGRLLYRCSQHERIAELARDRRLKRLTGVLISVTGHEAAATDGQACENLLDRTRGFFRRQREVQRGRLIADAADDTIPDEVVWLRLDAARWLHRVAYHLWRIRLHLNALTAPEVIAVPSLEEARVDVRQD
ncbi:Na/Pi cotransporter family protein [Halovulum sp. GXIMD14794]